MPAEVLHLLRRLLRRTDDTTHIVADRASAPLGVEDASTLARSEDDLRRSLRVPRLTAEPWYVDRVAIEGTRVTIAGWSMPVQRQQPAEGWFTINGRRFDSIRYPLPRQDVADVFWRRDGAIDCGFECVAEDVDDPYPSGVLEVRRVVKDTPRAEEGRNSWFKPDPARHADVPDAERRFRVIGDRDLTGFLVSGATDFHRLDRAARAIAGKPLHALGRVLDWGVGCGRVARHVPTGTALTGCDIDHDNVAWCSAHLRGHFAASKLSPPLPFEDASFDLIYGVSVFTHMRETMQMRWLEELARVSAPGCLLMMTVHGETAIDFSRLSPAEYLRVRDDVRRNGIVVSGINTQLDGHAEHEGEYVNVYHSADYVRRTWGRFFDVVHILPGYILHHDLVVMRKPRSIQ